MSPEPDATGRPGRVLLLMSSRTYRAGAFLRAADALGVPVIVGTEADIPLAERGGLRLDFGDPAASAAEVASHAADEPIAAVVAAEDDGTWLAAEAARRMGLNHNPPDAVAALGDKAEFRRRMLDAGLLSPNGMRIDIEFDPEDVAGRVPYPCVVKPRFLSGSQGVVRVDSPEAFVFAFQRIRRLLKEPEIRALGGELAGSLWCETYVPGEEVALEGMLTDGRLQVLALFDKPDPLEGPYFEETIYVTPSRHSAETQRAVTAAVEAAVSSVGLRTGPIHAELRINDAGAWLIDLAARSIGGLCARALRFRSGESLEALILRQALGEDVRQVERERAASGVMMIPIPQSGTLENVGGVEAAKAVRGVEDVVISVPIGDVLVPLPEGGRYLGFIFSKAETAEQAEASLRQAHACLEFAVKSV